MEQWVPLFHIFLSSPSPETSAANWFFQLEFQANSPPLTSSFLSLLLSPVPSKPPLKFLQTLPPFVQSRILSFLSSYRLRFDSILIKSVAAHVVDSSDSSFWVKHAAHNLLDEMPDEILCEDSFFDLPEWLRKESGDKIYRTPFLPCLPFDNSTLPKKKTKTFDVPVKELKFESISSIPSSSVPVVLSTSLSDREIEMAMIIKREIGTVESVQEAVLLAKKIQQLCITTQNIIEILSLIEPWEINDDMARVLLSNLSLETENELTKNFNFSSLVLSSIILPKLLILQKQPSSILISVTLDFCKEHPISAVNSLLLPLIFRNEGLNITLCDLITKIIKDCLHPLQVSFFIQRLLSNNRRERELKCLPKHLVFISNKLVWNESLFQLFYNMMNKDREFFLTPDSIEKLVRVIEEMAREFAKSLKFGNFMLCFVSKFGDQLKCDVDSLKSSVEKTDTFVTKAILAKLNAT